MEPLEWNASVRNVPGGRVPGGKTGSTHRLEGISEQVPDGGSGVSEEQRGPFPTILEIMTSQNLHVETPCGGQGKCGKCRVRVEGEVSLPDAVEREKLSAEELACGIRLACRCRVFGKVRILSANEATVNPGKGAFDGGAMDVSLDWVVNPVHVPWESLKKTNSLTEVLPISVRDKEIVRQVASAWVPGKALEGSLWCIHDRPMAFRSCFDQGPILGAVCDLGTTSVAVYIVDLVSGEVLGTASKRNSQSHRGADVISRINFALEAPDNMRELTGVLRDDVSDVLTRAAAEAGSDLDRCVDLVLVGNTAMHHFFQGVTPVALGRVPFLPTELTSPERRAAEFKLPLPGWARVRSLPLVGGYVGADALAAIYHASFIEGQVKLVVDLGTNAEIALIDGDKIWVCSTAAGPAFEGARIEQGMIAHPGAVRRVTFSQEGFCCEVVAGEEPRGICGSGLISAAKALLDSGAMNCKGRLLSAQKIPIPEIAARCCEEGKKRRVVLADGRNGPVELHQKDIRELQLAKGAVRAGMELLLERSGFGWQNVEACLVAGAFGSNLDISSAVAIGLFPEDLKDRIKAVGNAAGLGGLRMLLGGGEAWQEVYALAEKAEHILLEGEPDFESRYVRSMRFPDRQRTGHMPDCRDVTQTVKPLDLN